jgi:hypothetical protein
MIIAITMVELMQCLHLTGLVLAMIYGVCTVAKVCQSVSYKWVYSLY